MFSAHTSRGTPLTYRSRDGRHYFTFSVLQENGEIEVYCTRHPSLNGRSADAQKTHIFASGKLCFVSGRGPRTVARVRELAGQWAEYLLEYIRTGEAQH